MCMSSPSVHIMIALFVQSLILFAVLHPYYKFDYFDEKWGGEQEQQEQIAAGERNARNWTAEARETVNTAVSTDHSNSSHLITLHCY